MRTELSFKFPHSHLDAWYVYRRAELPRRCSERGIFQRCFTQHNIVRYVFNTVYDNQFVVDTY